MPSRSARPTATRPCSAGSSSPDSKQRGQTARHSQQQHRNRLMRSNANPERPRQPSRQLKNGPAPGEGGAPVKELDLNIVQKLAMIQCTDKEIAACLDVSEDTITRRKQNDPEFLEVLERGRGTGRMSLRRRQWERAQAGSDTMLIWLGKQILG